MSTTVAVTVLCSLGVGWAAVLVIGGRTTTAPVLAGPPPGASMAHRFREGIRVSTAVASAGFVGGLLGFGLGGRLMMRVLAATSPDAQGRLTDAEERVGEVTAGGTVFLALFLALFSAAAAGLFWLLRRWLPRRSVSAGLVAGGIVGGALVRVSGLLDPENRDFVILGPRWLAVLLCVAVVLVGSTTIAVLVDRWATSWPMPSWSVKGVAALLPFVLFVLPVAAVTGAVVVVAEVARPTRVTPRPLGSRPSIAQGLLASAGVLGLGWIGLSAVQILR